MENQELLKKLEELKIGNYLSGNTINLMVSNLDDLRLILTSEYIKGKPLEIMYIGTEKLPIELFEGNKLKIIVETPLVFTDEFCQHFNDTKDIKIGITDDLYQKYTFAEISAINHVITDIINSIPNDADEFTKAAWVYKVLGERIHYDYDGFTPSEGNIRRMSTVVLARSLKGALLEGLCVCIGFSSVYSKILTEIGIDNLIVSGAGEDKQSENADHAWNMLKIEGEWYHADLTLDADAIKEGRVPEAFLIRDSTISQTRRILYAEPTCIRKFLQENPRFAPNRIPQFIEAEESFENYDQERVKSFFLEAYKKTIPSKGLIAATNEIATKTLRNTDIKSILDSFENDEEKGILKDE